MRVFAELRNQTFYSIEELNAAAGVKMKAHNQKRMQKHPYTHEERFLAVDQPNLKPLPPTDFEIISYTDLKVSPNCCIYLGRDQHYYTVPSQHISKTAHVAYTCTLVRVYIDGEVVAADRALKELGEVVAVSSIVPIFLPRRRVKGCCICSAAVIRLFSVQPVRQL